MRRKHKKIGQSGKTIALRWLLRVLLYGWAVTIIFPVLWMFSTSLKSSRDFMLGDIWKWPKLMYLSNYVKAWEEANMGAYTFNTLFVVVLTVLIYVIMLTTTTYILGTYEFKLVKAVEKSYWAAMMIPGALLLVPLYFQVSSIGNVIQRALQVILNKPDLTINISDNLVSLAIIYAVQSLPVPIFLVTGFVKGVNKSFLEAARIDGAGEWSIFSRVVLPFVKPIVLFQCLTCFMGTWNEYLTALTFLESDKNYTLSVGIQKLIAQFTYQSDYGAIFAGLVISLLPILILYILFQNVIQNGTDMSEGLK